KRFQIDQTVVAALPPNIRDQLLDYVQMWESAADLLSLLDLLRTTHGALLFLLDYQAEALYRQGDYHQVLSVVERRQRRSTTLGSQMMEARALLGLGHEDHARAVADDISQAFSTNAYAVSTAAEIYAALGNFDLGRELLESYLGRRKGDLQATIALIALAQQQDQTELMERYLNRLGVGISPNMSDDQLKRLAAILAQSTHRESANAANLELQRRQMLAFEKLQSALGPYLSSIDGEAVAPDLAVASHNGPESIEVSRKEERDIQLSTVRHFGFSNLRVGQLETIATVLRGESILTVMPTGAGKSLCYQLPALTLPHMTLVISPLIALMKDQVESLPMTARTQATFINSTLTEEELNERMAKVAKGEYKLIYAAPERLRQREFLRALRQGGVGLFVIDEAHCVSLWGHDFRPDYLFVQEARLELGAPTTLAMTATAPPRIRDEILDYISNGEPATERRDGSPSTPSSTGKRPQVLAMDIFRNNLHLSAVHFNNEEEKLAALLKFVGETAGSGIVYVSSRHKAEQLAYQLRQANISAEAYHAGLENRGAIQDRFMNEETRVVVATIAFGMGIDKANIRFIVHFHPSRSLAAYYQEVGRAGRDGKPSQGVLFYSNNDWASLRRWAKADEHSIEFLEKVYAAIAAQLGMLKDAESTADSEIDPIRADLEKHTADRVIQSNESVLGPVEVRRLQQVINTDETSVRVAVSVLERAGLIDRSFDFPQDLAVSLPRTLPAAAKKDEDFTYLQQGLALRPGQSANFKAVDVANFMGWPLDEVERTLLDYQANQWLTIKGSRRAMLIELPPRPDDLEMRLQRLLEQSQAIAQRRIDDIIGYATAESCRHGYISAHFGSPPRTHCTVCDNCTGIRPEMPERPDILHITPDDADIEPMIIDCLISLPKPVGRSGLARILIGSLRAPVTADKARHFGQLKA
ncbi:MAG: DEAD/DEAH box helicase, partial [Caldilineaceae bacterium]|nr:DEAD/DEAH box helicase [Caldilineaceae bacterium]